MMSLDGMKLSKLIDYVVVYYCVMCMNESVCVCVLKKEWIGFGIYLGREFFLI